MITPSQDILEFAKPFTTSRPMANGYKCEKTSQNTSPHAPPVNALKSFKINRTPCSTPFPLQPLLSKGFQLTTLLPYPSLMGSMLSLFLSTTSPNTSCSSLPKLPTN